MFGIIGMCCFHYPHYFSTSFAVGHFERAQCIIKYISKVSSYNFTFFIFCYKLYS